MMLEMSIVWKYTVMGGMMFHVHQKHPTTDMSVRDHQKLTVSKNIDK